MASFCKKKKRKSVYQVLGNRAVGIVCDMNVNELESKEKRGSC